MLDTVKIIALEQSIFEKFAPRSLSDTSLVHTLGKSAIGPDLDPRSICYLLVVVLGAIVDLPNDSSSFFLVLLPVKLRQWSLITRRKIVQITHVSER